MFAIIKQQAKKTNGFFLMFQRERDKEKDYDHDDGYMMITTRP